MRKTSVLVVAALLLAAGVAIGALLRRPWPRSPVPNPATGTSEPIAGDPGGLPQVFRSDSPGFSLRYPSGWTVDTAGMRVEVGEMGGWAARAEAGGEGGWDRSRLSISCRGRRAETGRTGSRARARDRQVEARWYRDWGGSSALTWLIKAHILALKTRCSKYIFPCHRPSATHAQNLATAATTRPARPEEARARHP